MVLIAILLPAISISDDLLAMQNATETDSYVRRQQLVSNGAHPLAPRMDTTLPASVQQGITVAKLGLAPPPAPSTLQFKVPGMVTIQNRPPPAA